MHDEVGNALVEAGEGMSFVRGLHESTSLALLMSPFHDTKQAFAMDLSCCRRVESGPPWSNRPSQFDDSCRCSTELPSPPDRYDAPADL